MDIRYVPNLRWKRGEKNALRDLSVAGRENVLPLFLIGSDQFKPKKATTKKAEVPAPLVFAQEIFNCWGASPFYLDASSIPDTPGHDHRLYEIANHCRAMELELISVIRPEATASYLNTVKKVVAHDNRGVCLRISLQEMSEIPKWIGSWPFSLKETDLVIDYLNQAESLLSFGEVVLAEAFRALHKGDKWRSVTIVGTSIPDNFAGLTSGLYKIPRHEKVIWNQLQSAPLPYQLHFGDYATVSTTAPAPGIAWGFPITAKYTLQEEFLICRGVRTTGLGAEDADVQLVKHAKSIASHPDRHVLSHCWADREIDKIETGLNGPRNLEHWVRLGVNRHIELVRSMLP